MAMSPRLLRPIAGRPLVAPAVTPPTAAALAVWLDASDSSTLWDATTGGSLVTAGGGVARWEDKSGNGRHVTQGIANNRPLRSVASLAGKGSVDFDGLNDFITGTHGLSAKQEHSVFIAWRINGRSAGSDRSAIVVGNRTANTTGAFYGLPFLFNTNNYGLRAPFFGGQFSPTTTWTAPVANVVSFRINSSNTLLGIDRSSSSVTAFWSSMNLSGGGLEFGRGSLFDATAHTNLALYEVLIYNQFLDASGTTAVLDYIHSKWGLAAP